MLSHTAHAWATVIVFVIFIAGMTAIVLIAGHQPRQDDDREDAERRTSKQLAA